MLPRDVHNRSSTADPVLDEAIVLRLVRRYVPDASSVTNVDESGGEARAYAIDDGIILKVQRPHRVRPRTSLEKEAFFLNQLAAHPEISVPTVLGYGKDEGIEYICMTRMSGVPACAVALEGDQQTELMHELGRTLRRIHAVPQEPYYNNSLFPGVRSREEFLDRMKIGFDKALQALRSSPGLWPFAAAPEALVAEAICAVPASVDLVALHSNPGPEHTFVDPNTLKFTGLIDFGDAYIGHPAADCRWPRHEDRLALLEAYCADPPAAPEFRSLWRSVRLLSEMSALTSRPDRQVQALDGLSHLINDLSQT